jgi:hypothetical protein
MFENEHCTNHNPMELTLQSTAESMVNPKHRTNHNPANTVEYKVSPEHRTNHNPTLVYNWG